MIKIDKLYIKLLLTSWGLLTGLIIISAFIVKVIPTPYSTSLSERLAINSFTKSAEIIYQTQGLKALNHWLMALKKSEGIHFYVLKAKSKQLLFETKKNDALKKIIKNQTLEKEGVTKAHPYLFSQNIPTTNEPLKLVIHVSSLKKSYINDSPILFHRIAGAFLISLILSYVLITPVYRSVKTVRKKIHKIRKGNYQVRSFISQTSNELSKLENDVIVMAETIAGLIDSKNRLLQDISHELRSPLSRQLTAIELCKLKHKLTESLYLNKIEKENLKIESLVFELLEFSKMNQAQKQLHIENVNLRSIIQDVINDAQFESGAHNIALLPGDDVSSEADKGLLQRAFENIIRNAVKYSGKESHIEVSVTHTQDDFKVTVCDNGPGVKESVLPFLFEPFYRVNEPSQHKQPGYGLGLSIAQEIIALHDGTINAQNRAKGGLRISIVCPLIHTA